MRRSAVHPKSTHFHEIRTLNFLAFATAPFHYAVPRSPGQNVVQGMRAKWGLVGARPLQVDQMLVGALDRFLFEETRLSRRVTTFWTNVTVYWQQIGCWLTWQKRPMLKSLRT